MARGHQARIVKFAHAVKDEVIARLPSTDRHLTVTTRPDGQAVMVSWQDEDHRILETVWEVPETALRTHVWKPFELAAFLRELHEDPTIEHVLGDVHTHWLALKTGEVVTARYHWQQGHWPDGFDCGGYGRVLPDRVRATMRYVVPKAPA